jgi:hypothetical protein
MYRNCLELIFSISKGSPGRMGELQLPIATWMNFATAIELK